MAKKFVLTTDQSSEPVTPLKFTFEESGGDMDVNVNGHLVGWFELRDNELVFYRSSCVHEDFAPDGLRVVNQKS